MQACCIIARAFGKTANRLGPHPTCYHAPKRRPVQQEWTKRGYRQNESILNCLDAAQPQYNGHQWQDVHGGILRQIERIY